MVPENQLAFVGKRFGRVVVMHVFRRTDRKYHHTAAYCLCDCGNEKVIALYSLKSGNSSSCGCGHHDMLLERNQRLATHGASRGKKTTPTYQSWNSMKERCNNPNHVGYKYWGGRGIRVCDRWMNSFSDFLADMGERKKGWSLDRIDCNGNYCPENCRWIPKQEQSKNRRKGWKRRSKREMAVA